MTTPSRIHYDDNYFDWQKSLGEFGGWANKTLFSGFIAPDNAVLDFGCGGGFLLKNIECKKKIGVEINETAAKTACENGLEVYHRADDVPDNYVDVIISTNALEHTHHPLDELHKNSKIGRKKAI